MMWLISGHIKIPKTFPEKKGCKKTVLIEPCHEKKNVCIIIQSTKKQFNLHSSLSNQRVCCSNIDTR